MEDLAVRGLSNMLGEIIIKLDRNKLIQPVDTEAEEISYEELKDIPSERGCGSLGSSGK